MPLSTMDSVVSEHNQGRSSQVSGCPKIGAQVMVAAPEPGMQLCEL